MANKYKIYCETDGKWETVISTSAPTACPVNGAHTVTAGSATIIEKDIQKLDGSPETLTLDEYKSMKINEIDDRTGELIAQGFVYATKTFSLSKNAQTNLLGLKLNKDVLTYPKRWNNIDDTDFYDITDATDAENFHLSAMNTWTGHVDSGTTLKDSVRAATDKAGVDAVVDNR